MFKAKIWRFKGVKARWSSLTFLLYLGFRCFGPFDNKPLKSKLVESISVGSDEVGASILQFADDNLSLLA